MRASMPSPAAASNVRWLRRAPSTRGARAATPRRRRWPSRSRTCSTWPARSRSRARRSTAAIRRPRDALLVRQMQAAGAVLVGALNMDEYAYGFTTENTHDGPCHNPHDPGAHRRRLLGRFGRRRGGRPGADHARLRHQRLDPRAVVAVRRVRPEAHLRPAVAPRQLPFVASLDHLGPLGQQRRGAGAGLRRDAGAAARSGQRRPGLRPGGSARPPRCSTRARRGCASACSAAGSARWRCPLRARPWRGGAGPGAAEAAAVELPDAARARAAAFIITAIRRRQRSHLDDLRTRVDDFEPLSVDRFLAGVMLPAAWVQRAQRVRRLYRARSMCSRWDLLLAPAALRPRR